MFIGKFNECCAIPNDITISPGQVKTYTCPICGKTYWFDFATYDYDYTKVKSKDVLKPDDYFWM